MHPVVHPQSRTTSFDDALPISKKKQAAAASWLVLPAGRFHSCRMSGVDPPNATSSTKKRATTASATTAWTKQLHTTHNYSLLK